MKQVHSSGFLASLDSLLTLPCIPDNGEYISQPSPPSLKRSGLSLLVAWLSAQRVPLCRKAQSRWVGALLFDLGF
uniref:Uncharacterized protein n=1 Tax=Nomascus leucogenys TaxID=61853 RepID=A0A2I3G2C4_NOMLE